MLGKVSPELSGFTLGSANAWGIAAEATGPLFEGGRLVGQYKQSKAARNEFELKYRQTILNAFREVSDALVSRGQLSEVRQHQAQQVSALESAVKLSTERYLAGKADYYEVLEAQQQLFPAKLIWRAHNVTNSLPWSRSTKLSEAVGRMKRNKTIIANT